MGKRWDAWKERWRRWRNLLLLAVLCALAVALSETL